MIDLHCHILPGIDDGPGNLAGSLAMARSSVSDGVRALACTPHILPGLYYNTAVEIRKSTQQLQDVLDREGISLRLVAGADIHVMPDLVAGLRSGRLPSLGDTRYVLVEPPHHVAPKRLEHLFIDILEAGYVPILTHPERLSWIRSQYKMIERLVAAGVWMQITAGSLSGAFGSGPQYWAERMLNEGRVHILATDAHDIGRRRPELSKGRELAVKWVGSAEAEHLVFTRPNGILADFCPSCLPLPPAAGLYSSAADQGRTGRANRNNNPVWRDGEVFVVQIAVLPTPSNLPLANER